MIGFKSFLIQTDKTEVQHQIVIFVGMTCGIMMLLFTRFWGEWALTGNEHWFEYTRLCVVDQVWAVIGVSR
ncbi:hypothetical protein HanIR_Chr14g0714541 [Helianthus annuus]|nr:hypothetical protein HanIR_Chr14g0714541 [Helianthus annuus]